MNIHSHYEYSLTEKERDHIINFECKISNFHGLPEVHKSKFIHQICKENSKPYIHMPNPNDFKLRPIVAGPSCESHKLSNFLDRIVTTYLKYVKTYVKDDIDLLQYISEHVSYNSILALFDVVSLYSNIT